MSQVRQIERDILYTRIEETDVVCGVKGCDHKAVDFVIHTLNDVNGVEIELIIPICDNCISLVSTNRWILLYCIKCETPHWAYKPMMITKYGDTTFSIVDGCSNCIKDDDEWECTPTAEGTVSKAVK